MISKAEKEILLLKVKSPEDIDFGEAHLSILKENGYVDFAKFGRSLLKTDAIVKGDAILIKESMKNGGKLYKGIVEELVANGSTYPDYYKEYLSMNAIWFRLSSLEIIDDESFLSRYETRAGGEVGKALKSMSPNFYIRMKTNG